MSVIFIAIGNGTYTKINSVGNSVYNLCSIFDLLLCLAAVGPEPMWQVAGTFAVF